jgi:hypothetical protein
VCEEALDLSWLSAFRMCEEALDLSWLSVFRVCEEALMQVGAIKA